MVNADLIIKIMHRGDTIIQLTNGEVLRVKESPEQIQKRCLQWQRSKWLPIISEETS